MIINVKMSVEFSVIEERSNQNDETRAGVVNKCACCRREKLEKGEHDSDKIYDERQRDAEFYCSHSRV